MAAVGRISGPEWQRYPDPATEFEILRLTDPSFASGLTAPHLRQFQRRFDSLLYWSEREGARQAYLLDLKAGGSKQVTDVAQLDPSSLSLTPDERAAVYFDADALCETSLTGNLATRQIYKVSGGARAGITVAADGSILFGEGESIVRLSRQKSSYSSSSPVHEAAPIDLVLARPRHSQIVYRAGAAVYICELDGGNKRRLDLAPGTTGEILWTPDGRTLLYLHIPDDSHELIALREHAPEDNSDHMIARTSQFASVSANGDASVFVGASRSRATAYVLLLLRVARRELTLCEHRSSEPSKVSPIFSPDSQSVFFVSDRHGKSALYRVHVERFVEETNG
jgi:oligogalacturonide lyase